MTAQGPAAIFLNNVSSATRLCLQGIDGSCPATASELRHHAYRFHGLQRLKHLLSGSVRCLLTSVLEHKHPARLLLHSPNIIFPGCLPAK